MIVLDTRVVSELMRAAPDPRVVACLRARPSRDLVTTSITLAEILYGLRRMPEERRPSDLEKRFGEVMAGGFRAGLLSFDESAAAAYSAIMADRRRIGRSTDVLDAMIAAIALSNGAEVATRNTRHFGDCGLEVVDPWLWPAEAS